MDDDAQERQLNIHLDPEHLAGVYANFANISFSDYEFTLTFARIDHEVEEGDVPGVVVARVNMSNRFMRELLDAMEDSWSKWSSRDGGRPRRPGGTAMARWRQRPSRVPPRRSGDRHGRARGRRPTRSPGRPGATEPVCARAARAGSPPGPFPRPRAPAPRRCPGRP